MRIEIDQSGKIEDTNRLTIVAYSNGKAKSLKISAVEKQKILEIFRLLGYTKHSFVHKVFAGLIFILVRHEKTEEVVIDKEYLGNEAKIKNILVQLFRKNNIKSPNIIFGNIGKKSQAHKVAIDVFRGRRKADIIVSSKQVLNLFSK